jgi:hypothetical protein
MKRLLTALAVLCLAAPLAQAGLVIVGETVHRTTVTPGATLSGTITILNNGGAPVEVRLYQTDYAFKAAGENDYGAPGTSPRSNAKWFTLDANQLSIPTNGTVTVNYRGAVPAEAKLAGSFWSLVMVEQTEAVVAPTKGAPSERRAAIRTVVRHAVQVVTDLGNPAPAELKVLGRNFEADASGKAFSLDVENRGQWLTRPDVSMEVFDAAGASTAKVAAAKVRLYPACSFRYRFDLTALKPGKYNALVMLDSGDDNVSGAQYAFEIPR